MKKILWLVVALALVVVAPVFAQGGSEAGSGTFAPSKDIEWFVTSSPGGGSDIYSRVIAEIMTKKGLVNNQTILVTNKTDGGGEVVRLAVSRTKEGRVSDHTLLTFNSGDHGPMIMNTANRIANFTPIAIMAVDKQLLYIGEHAKYSSFEEVLQAVAQGKNIVIAGSKGDDILTYEALVKELGVTENQIAFITNDSTSDAITSVLGGHVDIVMSKPAAADQYVVANKLTPILALSETRFTGNLADAPTLSELGAYNNVEHPIWRGIVAPKSMSEEAAQFWSDVFQAVSESDEWKADYIEKYKLISEFRNKDEAKPYMEAFEKANLK